MCVALLIPAKVILGAEAAKKCCMSIAIGLAKFSPSPNHVAKLVAFGSGRVKKHTVRDQK